MGLYDSNDINLSQHNEASMKMNRINQLQIHINSINLNLLAFNEETGRFNYELHLSLNYSLLMEVYSKLKQGEQEAVMGFYEKVYSYILKHPVYKSKKIRDGPTVTSTKPDVETFENIRKRLQKFEGLIQWLLERHHLGSSIEQKQRV